MRQTKESSPRKLFLKSWAWESSNALYSDILWGSCNLKSSSQHFLFLLCFQSLREQQGLTAPSWTLWRLWNGNGFVVTHKHLTTLSFKVCVCERERDWVCLWIHLHCLRAIRFCFLLCMQITKNISSITFLPSGRISPLGRCRAWAVVMVDKYCLVFLQHTLCPVSLPCRKSQNASISIVKMLEKGVQLRKNEHHWRRNIINVDLSIQETFYRIEWLYEHEKDINHTQWPSQSAAQVSTCCRFIVME